MRHDGGAPTAAHQRYAPERRDVLRLKRAYEPATRVDGYRILVDPEKWREFRRRYVRELGEQEDLVRALAMLATRRRITLVYGARDEAHNDAVVVAAVVRARMKRTNRMNRRSSVHGDPHAR